MDSEGNSSDPRQHADDGKAESAFDHDNAVSGPSSPGEKAAGQSTPGKKTAGSPGKKAPRPSTRGKKGERPAARGKKGARPAARGKKAGSFSRTGRTASAGNDSTDDAAGSSRSRKRGRGTRARPATTNPPTDPRTARFALTQRILRDLRRLCAAIVEDTGAGQAAKEMERLETELTIELGGPDLKNRIRGRSRQFLRRLEQQLTEIGESARDHREGRVYCYRCASSSCEHALPPSPQDVFVGYDPTGRAAWGSFATLCVERCPEKSADLFDEQPRIVTVVVDAEDVRAQQLSVFGRSSRVYDVLGQICVGLFPGQARRGQSPLRYALTIQVVRSRDDAGRLTIGLNMIGLSRRPGDALHDLPDRDAQVLSDLLLEGKQRLERVNGDAAADDRAIDHAQRVLTWLARGVEHVYRQRGRRTRHAQQRATESDRPTQKALEDASRATAGRLYIDTHHDTFVILGPNGRVHVYSLAGLHVTSLNVPSEGVKKRVATHRWRPAAPAEWSAFRAVIDGLGRAASE